MIDEERTLLTVVVPICRIQLGKVNLGSCTLMVESRGKELSDRLAFMDGWVGTATIDSYRGLNIGLVSEDWSPTSESDMAL